MHFSELKTTLRRNLGNYEHVESTMVLVLEETDDIVEAMEKMEHNLRISVGKKDLIKPLGLVEEPSKQQELPIKEEAPKKKVTKKKVAKKVTKKAAPKEEVVIPTIEEMMGLCRDTANKLGSGEKVKSLIEEVCKAPSLKDADASTFIELKKKLEDA